MNYLLRLLNRPIGIGLIFFVAIFQYSLASPSKNLVPDASFELGSPKGLQPLNDATMKVVDSPVSSGSKSILIIDRESPDDALEMDITDMIKPGFSYIIGAHLQLRDVFWDHGFLGIVKISSDGARSAVEEIARNDINQSSFIEVRGIYTVPSVDAGTRFLLIINAANTTSGFFVDDVTIRPDMQVLVKSAEQKPAFSVDLGIPTADQKSIRPTVIIKDVLDEVVYSRQVILAQENQLKLPDGYYTIQAQATDSDGAEFEKELIFVVGNPEQLANKAIDQSLAMLKHDYAVVYRGWLKYLATISKREIEKAGFIAPSTLANISRLDGWVRKIEKNHDLLYELRGVQEWALHSVIDDSGQPFKLCIPPEYDASRSYPLVVIMHGYSGNHLEHSVGAGAVDDRFEVYVLGRSRGGRYTDHSEQDVLNVIRYIKVNWNIDDSRVHLAGGSMGGGGTFGLASRYPHLFASGRPTCGYAPHLPITNALHVPFYATHSRDDYVVPVLHSRGPLQKLAKAGGMMVTDECDGYGHASWNYAEGNGRASEWFVDQIRPDPENVKTIRFTALDGVATKAYWLKIEKWGPASRPAEFRAKYGAGNFLYLTLDNVGILELDTKNSPVQQGRDLSISVNGGVAHIVSQPLPDTLYVSMCDGQVQISDSAGDLPDYRRHTPGGAHLLYQNEPLLVVWGTKGSSEENQAMLEAARSARKGFNPGWPEDGGDAAPDGIPHSQLTYSRLPGKPDVEVTPEDLKNHNLILIGTAQQNLIVGRLAEKLPVVLQGDHLACSDGVSWDSDGLAFGLVHYNPENPKKLIYIVASNDSGSYVPGSFIPQLMAFGMEGCDLVVAKPEDRTIIAIRSFDPDWKWTAGYADSPVCDKSMDSEEEYTRLVAAAICHAGGADFSLYGFDDSHKSALSAGLTRHEDLANAFYFERIAIMEISGERLLDYAERFGKANEGDDSQRFTFYPDMDRKSRKNIDPDRKYRVAMSPMLWWSIVGIVEHVPDNYEITDLFFHDALVDYLKTVR